MAGKDLNRLSQIHPTRACVTVPIVLRVMQRAASLIDEDHVHTAVNQGLLMRKLETNIGSCS